MEVDRLRAITDAEKAKLQAEGHCYECKQQGHIAHACPRRVKAHSTPRAAKLEEEQEEGPATGGQHTDATNLTSPDAILKAMAALSDKEYGRMGQMWESQGFPDA